MEAEGLLWASRSANDYVCANGLSWSALTSVSRAETYSNEETRIRLPRPRRGGKIGHTKKCKLCGKRGHNRRSCPCRNGNHPASIGEVHEGDEQLELTSDSSDELASHDGSRKAEPSAVLPSKVQKSRSAGSEPVEASRKAAAQTASAGAVINTRCIAVTRPPVGLLCCECEKRAEDSTTETWWRCANWNREDSLRCAQVFCDECAFSGVLDDESGLCEACLDPYVRKIASRLRRKKV